jgi:hypothetical protein
LCFIYLRWASIDFFPGECKIFHGGKNILNALKMPKNILFSFKKKSKNILFWSAKGGKCPSCPPLRTPMLPYGWYFLYFSIMKQNWVQELILAWLWPHFHLVFWMRRDSNPQPSNSEWSLITTRQSIYCCQKMEKYDIKWFDQQFL